jgi:hypothetical protein
MYSRLGFGRDKALSHRVSVLKDQLNRKMGRCASPLSHIILYMKEEICEKSLQNFNRQYFPLKFLPPLILTFPIPPSLVSCWSD